MHSQRANGAQAFEDSDNESAPSSDPAHDLVAVFVTTGVATSDGPGPGVRRLQRAEAGRLVSARLAVHGERPPQRYFLRCVSQLLRVIGWQAGICPGSSGENDHEAHDRQRRGGY